MGDELRAGLVAGVMKLVTTGIAAEMSFVCRRQESAFMMIEPPRQSVRSGVFEIDDGVLAGSKLVLNNVLAGFVSKALVFNLGARVDVSLVKTGKDCCGRDTVKTIVVI